jgi:hypothetical protein
MQLIDNANKLHKTWSFILAGLGAAVSVAAEILPELKAVLPPGLYTATFIAVMASRAIKQTSLSK